MSWTDELGESVIWGLAILADGNLLCSPPTSRASWARSSMVSQHWSQGEESWCASVPAHSTSCGPWTFYLLLRLVTPPGLTKNDTEVVLPFPAPTYLTMYLSMWSSECVRLMGSVWSHPFELKCCSRSGTNVTSLTNIMHIGLHVAWCPLGVKHFNAVHVHSLAW